MKKRIRNEKIRNIAIIAHVDHGKTTLVDAMFKQSGVFRAGQHVDERIMDNMDLEKERGITISAKNCSTTWNGVKINILDTPGHADFGGEVERALSMVDGAILLVDASEGPLPQTRFVLKKTLESRLTVIVVINKIDRADARPEEVLDKVYDLFIDLGAAEEQLDFPVLYAIGREGSASTTLQEKGVDLKPLFDQIIKNIPGPSYDPEAPFQMLISDLGYSDYVGRLAIGKIINGSVSGKEKLVCIDQKNQNIPLKISKIQSYSGLTFVETDHVEAGDIVVVSGIEEFRIGDTICMADNPLPLPRISIDEPTIAMQFSTSDSPFLGKEGKIVQSRKIAERLKKETLLNVAIQVEEMDAKDTFKVKGRGEFQMAILIETMRREGFELCVGRPEVIFKRVNGELHEPIEQLFVECEEIFMGIVTEKLSIRKAKLTNLINKGNGRIDMEFSAPSRSLIGYRDEFLTDTKGTGIMNSLFAGYEAYRGDFPTRYTGSLISDRQGQSVPYALFNLEPRGEMLISPGTPVYEGMIIGEHNKDTDLVVNPCKEKKLSNMRASGKDENTICSRVRPLTLERALNFIKDDEFVEITPLSIRLRKKILSAHDRKTAAAAKFKEK